MDEERFTKILDDIPKMGFEHFQKLFQELHYHFKGLEHNPKIEAGKIAWRCRQAMMLVEHRKP